MFAVDICCMEWGGVFVALRTSGYKMHEFWHIFRWRGGGGLRCFRDGGKAIGTKASSCWVVHRAVFAFPVAGVLSGRCMRRG